MSRVISKDEMVKNPPAGLCYAILIPLVKATKQDDLSKRIELAALGENPSLLAVYMKMRECDMATGSTVKCYVGMIAGIVHLDVDKSFDGAVEREVSIEWLIARYGQRRQIGSNGLGVVVGYTTVFSVPVMSSILVWIKYLSLWVIAAQIWDATFNWLFGSEWIKTPLSWVYDDLTTEVLLGLYRLITSPPCTLR